jgi:hypothetical protein
VRLYLHALKRFEGHAGLGGGFCGLHGVFGHRQFLRDSGHGQTCVDHLRDAACTLGVGQVALLVVGDYLVHDSVDGFGGGICCRGGGHVDRHGAQADFAGRHGATLPVVL